MTYLLIHSMFVFLSVFSVNDVTLSAEKVYCDHLGNVYLLENNRLNKYNDNLEFYAAYDCQERIITSVDVSDPLRILVYFANAGEIVFLDKQMSPIGDPVNLNQTGYYDVPAVCSASRGGFWLFDSRSRQIINIDRYGEPGLTTSVVDQFSGLPNQLEEHNSKLYLGFPGKAVLVFNAMGAYQKTLPFAYQGQFVLLDDYMMYHKDSALIAYNLNLAQEEVPMQDIGKWESFGMNKQKLFYLIDGKLTSQTWQTFPF